MRIAISGLVLALIFAAPLRSSAPASTAPEIANLELKSHIFHNTRTIRVLLPPGYGESGKSYPVFYFTDGIAAFDGPGWGLPDAVERLRRKGALRDFIFVGIDNGGSTRESKNPMVDRASEYLPFPDPSWTKPPVPTPRGALFPRFLLEEVKPLIDKRYRTSRTGQANGIAGTSFGGLAALYTLTRAPSQFGYVLIESPSLHAGNGALIGQLARLKGWRGRIHIGVGTEEGDTQAAAAMTANARRAAALLRQSGATVHFVETPGAVHGYAAWRARLEDALVFLLARNSAKPVTLVDIKTESKLAKMELIRQSRLSVARVREEEWAKVLTMAGER